MKKNAVKLLSLALSLLCLCSLFSGCKKDEAQSYYSIINGRNIYFVSDSEKERWRAYIETLVKNEEQPFVIGDEVAYGAPDPSLPSISHGISFGLFDVNLDGVPELFVDLGGGSAGNAFYEIYDIYTGRLLGTLGGGAGGSWCVYLSADNGKYAIFGEYWLRAGFNCGSTHVSRLAYFEADGEYGSLSYLSSVYESVSAIGDGAEHEYIYETDEYIDYYVNGESTDFETYANESEAFRTTYLRIPETHITMIHRRDVCEDGDTREAAAKKITDALLSANQRFVAPIE